MKFFESRGIRELEWRRESNATMYALYSITQRRKKRQARRVIEPETLSSNFRTQPVVYTDMQSDKRWFEIDVKHLIEMQIED